MVLTVSLWQLTQLDSGPILSLRDEPKCHPVLRLVMVDSEPFRFLYAVPKCHPVLQGVTKQTYNNTSSASQTALCIHCTFTLRKLPIYFAPNRNVADQLIAHSWGRHPRDKSGEWLWYLVAGYSWVLSIISSCVLCWFLEACRECLPVPSRHAHPTASTHHTPLWCIHTPSNSPAFTCCAYPPTDYYNFKQEM